MDMSKSEQKLLKSARSPESLPPYSDEDKALSEVLPRLRKLL